MKIHLLKVPAKLRPASQPFKYPAHNDDFGVEQDFFAYLERHPELLTDDPAEADWHYLPVYWTRWHLNHDYGKQGREELGRAIASAMLDDGRTFTICQYDEGPGVETGRTVTFLASRRTPDGLDIPLLSKPHRPPLLPRWKRWTASFAGRLTTHPIRQQMAEVLQGRRDVQILEGDRGGRFFAAQLASSRLALAPRGHGGSSFRFYEAMQLGVPPVLIGEPDTRPFPRFVDWGRISFYLETAGELPALLDATDRERLKAMGVESNRVFREQLDFGRWCGLAIRELEQLR